MGRPSPSSPQSPRDRCATSFVGGDDGHGKGQDHQTTLTADRQLPSKVAAGDLAALESVAHVFVRTCRTLTSTLYGFPYTRTTTRYFDRASCGHRLVRELRAGASDTRARHLEAARRPSPH